MKKKHNLFVPILCGLLSCTGLHSDQKQLSFAQDLMDHGLYDKSIESYLTIYYQTEDKKEKAICLLNLGKLSMKRGNTQLAVKNWRRLVDEFPTSVEAAEIKESINQIIIAKALSDANEEEESLNDLYDQAKAIKYLENAAFFKPDRLIEKFIIDPSFIDTGALAISWLDKIIKEFPNTNLHFICLKKKFFLSRGVPGSSKFDFIGGTGTFTKDPVEFRAAINAMSKVVQEVISKFPEQKNTVAAMCYQIGYEYWKKRNQLSFGKDWPKDGSFSTEQESVKWFQQCLKYAANGSFYAEYVKLRLSNLGYDR